MSRFNTPFGAGQTNSIAQELRLATEQFGGAGGYGNYGGQYTPQGAASISAGGMPAKSPCSAPMMDVAFRVLAPADARNWLMFGVACVGIYLLFPDTRDDAIKKDEAGQLINSHVIWILKLAVAAYLVVSFLFHCRYP